MPRSAHEPGHEELQRVCAFGSAGHGRGMPSLLDDVSFQRMMFLRFKGGAHQWVTVFLDPIAKVLDHTRRERADRIDEIPAQEMFAC